MTRFRKPIALAMAAMTITATMAAGFTPAGAQEQEPPDVGPQLDLVDQTLVVTDEPAQIVVAVSDPPEDARIAIAIFADPARSRDEIRRRHEAPPTSERLANFECTLAGECFDQAFLTTDDDGHVTVALDDAVIGERLRRDEGALTVVVSLLGDAGVLDEFSTSFLVLHESSARRVRLAFLSSLTAPVAHGPDQSLSIDPSPLVDRLEQVPADVPVTFDLRPESLTALLETDAEALGEILDRIDGRPLLRSPWVAMDEEAWRTAGEADRVVAQYARGNETVETLASTLPSAVARLDPDATQGTLSLLRASGTATVIAADTQLDPATRATPANQPFTILDDNGVAMTALRIDTALHDTLDGDDPELAAHHALAELLMEVRDGDAADAAILLDLDAIDAAVLDTLVGGIDDHRELRIEPVAELANLDPQRLGGTPARAELRPQPAPDVSIVAADLRAAESAIATLSAMLEPETESVTALSTQLLAAVSSDLTASEAGAYADAVFAEVLERTAGIEVPAGDRITLTDRRTDLPLTIVNNQGVALNVELVLSAEKIRFPNGERRALRLEPGDNDLVIPVETLASGDARVTATVVSPGGGFELATGTVDIRSTAISGLGLAISIVALVILGAWWIRTILRVRRNRAAATVAAAEPEEGES